jgi:hypothetical protein
MRCIIKIYLHHLHRYIHRLMHWKPITYTMVYVVYVKTKIKFNGEKREIRAIERR